MSSTDQRPIPPPIELVRDKETVVIVSSRKPIAVYFSRAILLVEKQILFDTKSSKTNGLRIEFVACGGAISRCQQVARYVMQALLGKYRYLVTNLEKSQTLNKAAVLVNDAVHSAVQEEEENAFDIQQRQKHMDQIRIVITGVSS